MWNASLFLCSVALAAAAPAMQSRGADPAALIEATNAVADPASLARYHESLGSEPHVAGTPGDLRTIERLAKAFGDMGLEVEVHRFAPLLARPIAASLEIVEGDAPADASAPAGRRGVLSLDLRERNLLEDPSVAHPELTYGWNAYSGSGDVTAGVVYANYGTREDFEKLKAWGVDCRGKIVLARYGGNFRGYKAKFAEEAGAAGVVIFTDPADSGDLRGPVYPEGGWANDTCIQRGSILTLGWPGDPLTPGREATKDAERLDLASVALPRIPVQPIGYAAAERIIARMNGREVPDASWKGGIRQTYRLEGGETLRLRLRVEQERFIGETANVVGMLRGATRPDEWVVVGCHHDAWGFGAADPLAGTIVLLESARAFAEAAARGVRPERSILFAAWGAEEFGIIGSTEWVESRRDRLASNAVVYINLDMAAMGHRIGAGASPSMHAIVRAAMDKAISPFDDAPIAEAWSRERAKADQSRPAFGDLGGGSDHVGFWCHALVPCIALNASGSSGVSYHSNYDTIAWYRKIVGEDYRSALLVTRLSNAIIAKAATGAILPDDPAQVTADALRVARALRQKAEGTELVGLCDRLVSAFEPLVSIGERAGAALARVRAGEVDAARATRLNLSIRALRDAWRCDNGLVGRPWFRNLYASTDRSSGYAASMLPLAAEAIEDRDAEALAAAVGRYERVAEGLRQALDGMVGEVESTSPGADPAGSGR